jgi:Uma2 family endonuclease
MDAFTIAERQRLGLDRHDEVWDGVYHMAPAASSNHAKVGGKVLLLLGPIAHEMGLYPTLEFNLGVPNDFRVPDLGFHRSDLEAVWLETAAVVVEVRSPDDESFEKFEFFFRHGVEEVLIVELAETTVTWFDRGLTSFESAAASSILGVTAAQVLAALGWS